MDKIILSDEQVDQLNSYAPVQLARTEFLSRATEHIKSPTPESNEARQLAEDTYSAVFAERLAEVIQYVPQPKDIATLSQNKMKGFKK